MRDAAGGSHACECAVGLTYPPVEVRVRGRDESGDEGSESGEVEVEATYAEDRR